MDLPRNIQALKTIYKYYWSNININDIPDFEKYYDLYYEELKNYIEAFRIKTEMCDECFNKGLKARIYRTWASIITQIHAGYVAEDVFGIGSIDMNDELDHAGKDFIITYNFKIIPVQIKKESKRPESRITRQSKKNNDFIVNIKYCVPNSKDFKNPRYKKTNELKPQMLDFVEFSPSDGILKRYENGFVVFTDKIFRDIQKDYFQS
jgi:hypothetical protein